ncbi:MAG TPA: nucleotide sugar dehydrogenase [Acidimicrobiales bacterium]|jgi:nucleotide sugar dehydrogenase
MKVSLVGLGKLGLPVAVCYALAGHDVVGCDVNPHVVEQVNRGVLPAGIEGVGESFDEVCRSGRLRATTDTSEAVAGTDVTVLLVPIGVVDHRPDYRHMDAAVEAVAAGLQPGHLVVFETTLAVGDTRERFAPVLAGERFAIGEDLFVAFSPERVQSHRVLHDLRSYPKLVGGLDPESTKRAVSFYEQVLDADIVALRDAETAELTKLAECVYRDVNIALANEFARFAHSSGIEIDQVIEAANSEPLSHLHDPGAGVGGHCIPVYPYFLLAGREDFPITALARRVNDSMPGWVVDRVRDRIGDLTDRRVLILGLSYRANLRETSGSVALALIAALRAAGAQALCLDPNYSDDEISEFGADALQSTDFDSVDAVILQAYHREFAEFPWDKLRPGTLVLDGRNTLDAELVEGAGLEYLGVGRRGRR